MSETFDGPRAKIRRAKGQIQRLDSSINRVAERNLYWLRVIEGQEPTHRFLVASPRHAALIPPTTAWSVRMGEVANNLRSALDQTVSTLVRMRTEDDSRSQFVIAQGTFNPKAPALKGLACEQIRMIADRQPSQTPGGYKQSPLWWLSAIDNANKHRGLVPVMTAGALSSLQTEPIGAHHDHRIDFRLPLRPGAVVGWLRIKDGYPLTRVSGTLVSTIRFATDDSDLSCIGGREVVPVLREIAAEVDSTVDALIATAEPHAR